jgi:hypothetical protein
MMNQYRNPLRERRTLRRLLQRLRRGEVLCVSVSGAYLLHGGDEIERDMANRLISSGLEPGGDTLFPGMCSQTYRMAPRMGSEAG